MLPLYLLTSLFLSQRKPTNLFFGGTCDHSETKFSNSSELIYGMAEIIHGGANFRSLEYLEN